VIDRVRYVLGAQREVVVETPMRRSHRQRLIDLVSIVLTAAPFAFALIRAFSTGSDLRFLWTALASALGATGVMVVAKARHRTPMALLAVSAAAIVIATLLAGSTALLLGARSAPAVWAVAFAFGLCCAAGSALHALSSPRANDADRG
jgi:hypothetical protein